MRKATDDELLREIGQAILISSADANAPAAGKSRGASDTRGTSEPGPKNPDLIQIARRYLSARYNVLHAALCADHQRKKVLLSADETTLATAIADVVTPLLTGVPVLTVATLIARIGLSRLCAGNPFGPIS